MKWGRQDMQSKTSLLNKVLVKNFTSSVMWLTVGYFLLSLLSLPLPIYISSLNMGAADYGTTFGNDNVLFLYGHAHLIISIIFSATLAIVIYNYKNNADTNDFIHSLPIKRLAIFNSGFFVGVIAIFVPTLLTAFVIMIEKTFISIPISMKHIAVWLLFILIAQVMVFIISVFAGMFVNSITLHIEMILIMMFVPYVLWFAIVFNAATFFDGIMLYTAGGFRTLLEPMENTSIVIYLFKAFGEGGFGGSSFIIWLVVIIGLLVGSAYLYKIRRNERVNQPFNYQFMYYVLVVLLSILGMLLLSGVLSVLLPDYRTLSILIITFSAVVTYVFVLMFTQDTVRIKFRLKEAMITLISVVLFLVGFFVYWDRYTSYIPNEADIKGVNYNDGNGIHNVNVKDSDKFNENYTFDIETDKIKEVRDLHSEIVRTDSGRNNEELAPTVTITYLLKNGKLVSRQFGEISASSDVGQRIINSDIPSFSKDKDFLYQVKSEKFESISTMTIGSMMFDPEEISLKDFNVLAKGYQNEMNNIDTESDIYAETGTINIEVNTNYNVFSAYSGLTSLYNKALQSFMKEHDYEFNGYSGNMLYKVDLNKVDDVKQLFNDIKTKPYSEVSKKYDFVEVAETDKEEEFNKLNEMNFDMSGDTLYIIGDHYNDGDSPMYVELSVVVK